VVPDTQSSQILLIEDEPAVLASLRRRLAFEGYSISTAVTGLMGLEILETLSPNLVILDVMLPEMNGFEVAKRIRTTSSVPILMLTARDSVQDRVQGLESGADDYLCKPFAIEELLARVKALLRRSRQQPEESASATLVFGHLRVLPSSREVFCNEQAVQLTFREFELLSHLIKNARMVLTRDQILESLWGYDQANSSNVVDVHVKSLRSKLEVVDPRRLLQTVRGVGYVLREE
jgi:two-component system, OmpR family, response regulator MprA